MPSEYSSCRLCARACGVDRENGEIGFCRSDSLPRLARAALHFWEEPIISGVGGSGTVFFVGCSLGCSFCQNREISSLRDDYSVKYKPLTPEKIAEIMLRLEKEGAHNINFVTPTHHAPAVIASVRCARERGLAIPIVYNTGSYDSIETAKALSGSVDIYLADYKFHRSKTAAELASAPDYPEVAKAFIREAVAQRGAPVVEEGIMRSGVIVRILLLPGHLAEAKLSLKYLYEEYGDKIYISLMNQYTPMPNMPPPLNRRVTEEEYSELINYAVEKGVRLAFTQERGTAKESFIPSFNLEGVE